MHVCHVVESSFFYVWTILSQYIEPTTMVTYDAGLISVLLLCRLRRQSRQCRVFFFTFLEGG